MERTSYDLELVRSIRRGDGARKHTLKAPHDAGARLLLGTDCLNRYVVHGFAIHDELQNFVEAGLSPYEALKAGTRDAAEFLEALDTFGTVAIGRRADLLLVEGNPLVDVRNVARRAGVMLRGQWWPETALQQLLEELAVSYHEKPDVKQP